MKNETKPFKNSAILIATLYCLYVLFTIGLLYATGHKVDFFSSSNIEILSTTILFLSTAILLIIYSVIHVKIIRFVLILLLFACSLVITYNLYIIISIEPDFFGVLLPTSFCLFLLIKTISMIIVLFKKTKN
ncbi:membrane hypothetical protein [Tenacibaculum sp. 190524A05c]